MELIKRPSTQTALAAESYREQQSRSLEVAEHINSCMRSAVKVRREGQGARSTTASIEMAGKILNAIAGAGASINSD